MRNDTRPARNAETADRLIRLLYGGEDERWLHQAGIYGVVRSTPLLDELEGLVAVVNLGQYDLST